jgi:TolB-like protein/Tfp pilus assembly protein PilF
VEADTPAEASAAAVFLSYASQDAPAAERVAMALREAGIEVWFDRNALRGGDAWDRQIRRQIKDCALFVPVISANSQARSEGYFRLEWTLADQRTQLMGKNRTFILPVCVDGTGERNADVPDSFLSVQWTRLPAGETSPAFVARVRGLLAPASPALTSTPVPPPGGATSVALKPKRTPPVWIIPAALVVLALGVAAWFYMQRSHATGPQTASFSPPPHSIAVLPFANLSGDKDQQYFSDGLTEELLNSLSQITALQVAARTSAFSFGDHPDLTTVAHRLNVGAVLEGSVRRSEHTVRITVQLINAITGFNLWSQSYDRDLSDVLKLQAEIATAVAEALKVKLLGDVASKIELGNTRNPAALDAFLRARTLVISRSDPQKDMPAAIDLYNEAIRLDPNYALAFANRSMAYIVLAAEDSTTATERQNFTLGEADARHAIALAPDLADAHLALGFSLESGSLQFDQAEKEYDRAVSLAPGNAHILGFHARFAGFMGHFDTAIANAHRAIVLDPIDRLSYSNLGRALYAARQYREAAAAFSQSLIINPAFVSAYVDVGTALLSQGDFNGARLNCEKQQKYWFGQQCLAVVYEKLGRHAEAQAMLARLRTETGEAAAYQVSAIYAQWGDHAKGLEWLETALRLRDPGLVSLKTDAFMDPLRQEARFKAVLAALKFPD